MPSIQSAPQDTPALRIGLPALGFAVLALLGFRTIAHTSVWSHLSTGRWIASEGVPRIDTLSFATAEGTRWMADTWLYDLILFFLWKGGPTLATLVHVAALLTAFALLLPIARRFSRSTSILFAVILSAWMIAPLYEVRPSILVLPIPALFVFLLASPRSAAMRWGGVLIGQVLWTNSSPTFLMGPVICAAFAVEATLRGRAETDGAAAADATPAGRLWLLTAAALLATLLNPYGPGLYQKVAWVLTDPIAGLSREWISPFGTLFASELAKHISTIALAVGAAGLLLYREKLPAGLTLVTIVCAVLFMFLQQNLQLFALLAFPFFALSFDSVGQALDDKVGTRHSTQLARLTAVGIALVSIGLIGSSQYYRSIGSASAFGAGVNTDLVPKEADVLLSDPAFPAQTLNLPIDGGYLAWAYPDRRIFLDARTGLYDPADIQQVLAGLSGNQEAYAALLAKWQPQAILLNAAWHHPPWPPPATALAFLLQTGDWRLAYFDGTTHILLRNTPELAALASDGKAQSHGLAVLESVRRHVREQVDRTAGVPNSPRLVGAASTFYTLQRFGESAAAYDLLVANTPGMKSAWLPLGVALLQVGRAEEAVSALETARDLADNNVLCWLWLSRAYAKADRTVEAADAYTQATALDPTEAGRFGPPGGE